MKTVKWISPNVASLVCAAALTMIATPARPAGALEEEPAVWKAMVEFLATDNASKPFRQLYLQSDFDTGPLVASSMADTTRREFRDLCGLSSADAKAMVAQLQAANAESVPFEESIAEAGKLKLTKKKVPKARYVALSRVTFDPTHQYAWLAVDLSGTSGAITRLDKVAGQWTRTSKCGGWMRSE
jgi:hypothetical protein